MFYLVKNLLGVSIYVLFYPQKLFHFVSFKMYVNNDVHQQNAIAVGKLILYFW